DRRPAAWVAGAHPVGMGEPPRRGDRRRRDRGGDAEPAADVPAGHGYRLVEGVAAPDGYTPDVPKRDPHDVLGVARGASQSSIKAAWRRLAREHHPDLSPGDAAAA